MYFPTPIPFASEYPLIVKWCEPFTVSVTHLDRVFVLPEPVHAIGVRAIPYLLPHSLLSSRSIQAADCMYVTPHRGMRR